MDHESRLEIVPSRVAAQLGELPPPALRVARLCDGSRNLEALCAASRLPAEKVEPIVQKLMALGVVQRSAPVRRGTLSEKALAWAHQRQQPFSDDEERFFASPVLAEE